MNSFGRIFRISIYGQSHGSSVGILIDGCPPGIPLSSDDFAADLLRRKAGAKGTSARIEADIPIIQSGVYKGRTSGDPILITFENKNIDSSGYEELVNKPRPGHADFAATKKYSSFNDPRGGGHFSGRLTIGLVAAGVIAKKIIEPLIFHAELIEAGGNPSIEKAVNDALESKDTIGGIVECKGMNIPVGLGEPFFDSVESLLSHIIFSIPAIKAIEFGSGFAAAKSFGSLQNDEIISPDGKTRTNNAGGINGGITNGNEIIFRCAVKPASSIPQPQKTIDLSTNEQVEISVGGRHDSCIALRVPVIVEAAAAIVFADLLLIDKAIYKK